jgi:NAD(P)-dependent dehydrogenase (short-subunit alcohol dehydrogenase family)
MIDRIAAPPVFTPQAPIASGFTAASTASEAMRGIDLTGKVAIVTGGYSGLGRETVRVFLAAGARVIVPSRNVERAQTALEGVIGAEIASMDLVDPASIDAFSKRFLETGLPLHILVNSAGIMALPELTRDARGHELQFATNHLGHFHLTLRLWPALVKAQGARVVSVSSKGHRFSPVVFDDIDFERRPYDPWAAYGQSKTANILFAVELDARGQKDRVRAFAVHPGGVVDTGLAKHVSMNALKASGAVDSDGNPIIDSAKGLKTVAQGAATQVWCATSPRLDGMGGVYCEDSDIAPQRRNGGKAEFSIGDSLRETGVWPYAVDRDAAARLWTVSEHMVGLSRSGS